MRDFDWAALVPSHIAARQIAWERRTRILRAIAAGARIGRIANVMGISVGRTRFLRDEAAGEVDRRSLVELWMQQSGELAALADMLRAAERAEDAVGTLAAEGGALAAERDDLRRRIIRALDELDAAPDADPERPSKRAMREVLQANTRAWAVLAEGRDPPSKRRAEDAPRDPAGEDCSRPTSPAGRAP